MSDCPLVYVGLAKWWCSLTQEQMAAWAQGIGTIVALLIAILVPYWQTRHQHRRELETAKYDAASASFRIRRDLVLLRHQLKRCQSKLTELSRKAHASEDMPILAWWAELEKAQVSSPSDFHDVVPVTSLVRHHPDRLRVLRFFSALTLFQEAWLSYREKAYANPDERWSVVKLDEMFTKLKKQIGVAAQRSLDVRRVFRAEYSDQLEETLRDRIRWNIAALSQKIRFGRRDDS